MIKLRSGNTYLDVVDDGSLQITKSVQDVEDFTARTSSFSQNFLLPFTPNNNTFFAHFYNVSSKPDSTLFDATKREPIIIEDDGIIVMEGYMQLIQADPISRTYEVVCFDDVANIVDILRDKTIKDLTVWDSLIHVFNYDNIKDSWSGNLFDGDIKYPYVDYGDVQKRSGIVSFTREIFDYTFRPWIRLKRLFDEILHEAGYTYESNFLENDDRFKEIYYSLSSNGVVTDNDNYFFIAGFDDADNITPSGANYVLRRVNFKSVDGTAISGVSFTEQRSPATIFDNTNNRFTPISSGKHSMRIQLNCVFSFSTQVPGLVRVPSQITVYLRDSSQPPGSLVSASVAVKTLPFSRAGDNFNQTAPISELATFEFQDIDLVGGVAYEVIALFQIESSSEPQTNVNASGTYWQMLAPPQAQTGFDIDLRQNVVETSQIDIFRAVLQHFNMYVESNKSANKKLFIEPYNDYIDSGNVVDWTDKVDLSQGVSIRPITELQKKTAEWRFTDDEDYYSIGQDMGNYKIVNDNDFVDGEESVVLPYGAPTTAINTASGLFNLSIFTYRLYKVTGDAIQAESFVPRIAYLPNIDDTGRNLPEIIDTTDNTAETPTIIAIAHHVYQPNDPFILPFDGDTANFNDFFDLTFNSTQNYLQNAGAQVPPRQNAYTTFWQRYVNEIYNNEAKVVEADLMLTPSDILTFRFNDRVFFKDTFYRVLEIQNYAVGQRQSTRVKMVSLVGEAASPWNDCDGIVTEFNSDGSVTFSGSNTEECCRRYGYRFINGECIWRPQSGWVGAPLMPPPPQTFLPIAGEPVVGACCFSTQEVGDQCEIMTQAECLAVGGNWLGSGSDCTQCSPGVTPAPFNPE